MYRITLAIIFIPSLTAAVLLRRSFVFFPWRSMSKPSSQTLSSLSYLRISWMNALSALSGKVIFPKLSRQYSTARIFCCTSCNGSSTSELSELLLRCVLYDGVQRFVFVQRPYEINNGTLVIRICCNIFRYEGIHDVIDVVKRSNNKGKKIILVE